MSATLTIRIDESTKTALDEIAQGAHRSRSHIAGAALEAYIRRSKWLQAKIDHADASGVLSESETDAAELEQGIDGADYELVIDRFPYLVAYRILAVFHSSQYWQAGFGRA